MMHNFNTKIRVIKHGGREQPYKSRDMVVSDSGLGRLLVNIMEAAHPLKISEEIFLLMSY